MTEKLTLTRALVVEGRYDAARLANLVEGTILTTDGFAIFKERDRQALFRQVATAQGLLILTDPDAAVLYGLLNRIDACGLELLDVHPFDARGERR